MVNLADIALAMLRCMSGTVELAGVLVFTFAICQLEMCIIISRQKCARELSGTKRISRNGLGHEFHHFFSTQRFRFEFKIYK